MRLYSGRLVTVSQSSVQRIFRKPNKWKSCRGKNRAILVFTNSTFGLSTWRLTPGRRWRIPAAPDFRMTRDIPSQNGLTTRATKKPSSPRA